MTEKIEKAISNHSEKTKNYLRSILEIGEPIKRDEFIEIYINLSEGKKRRENAKQAIKELSKRGMIKIIDNGKEEENDKRRKP